MPKRCASTFPLLFLHDVARQLANWRREAQASAPPATTVTSVTQATSRQAADDFLITLPQLANLGSQTADAPHLTPDAYTWLAQPSALQLDALRQAWWQTMLWAPHAWSALTFPSWMEQRWGAVVTAVCGWCAQQAPDTWIPWRKVEPRLVAQQLYAPPGAQGHLPRLRHVARARVTDLVRGLLGYALPALGLSEIRGAAGTWQVRPTGEGQRWLTTALARRASAAAPVSHGAQELTVPVLDFHAPRERVTLTVEAEALLVRVPPGAPPAATFTLAHVAQWCRPGPPTVYRLTQSTLARGVTWGLWPGEIRFWLVRWCEGEIPPGALQRLHTWQAALRQLTATPGYRVQASAAGSLGDLRRRRAVRRRTLPLNTDELWVEQAQAPALFRYLRQRGYVVQEAVRRLPLLSYAPRALPLPALLTLCRTYAVVQAHVPGLAPLHGDVLRPELEAALSPAERQAADRLSAAQWRRLREIWPDLATSPAPDYVQRAETQAGLQERLAAALREEQVLFLTYIDAHAHITERQVVPLRLAERWGRTYLVARCALRGAERHFRLERIVKVEPGA